MKTKLFTILALCATLMLGFTACNTLENDTTMTENMWTLKDAAYDNVAGSPTGAIALLYITGYHTKPYEIVYSIDGKAGVGELAMYRLDIPGECPSGSRLDIVSTCSDKDRGTAKYHGTAQFQLPILSAGLHTFTASVTNEYGETVTESRTFIVHDKKPKIDPRVKPLPVNPEE